MEKSEDPSHKKILEADRLYRAGLKLREIGERLDPPVTPQRVTQLLLRGVQLGLLPEIPQKRRRGGEHLDEATVRAVALRFGERARVAHFLHVKRSVLEERFGHILDQAAVERRAIKRAKQRQNVVDAYLAEAKKLGYNPSSTDIPPKLASQIMKYFTTFHAFWTQIGISPDYRKKSWRERQQNEEIPHKNSSL